MTYQLAGLVGAGLVLVTGFSLREYGTYQTWTLRHIASASVVQGVLAACFVASIWLGLKGQISAGPCAAAFAVASMTTYRRRAHKPRRKA